ncbi:hypothetical protein Prudu_1466S001400 [Prunus dulcis]|uniref:Ankyrin repeat family protein n=1 Tax=Prunus dulcis TaxID=3755 RepID=A0A5H2XRC2_PRUDU|nr:hypothetical protein Prudu_1466S001400 [Prunus dulcis]
MLIRRVMDRSPGYSELMSDLITRRREVTTTQSSEPPAQSTYVATAPALMDHMAVGPMGFQAPTSSASSVGQPFSARRRHLPTSTTDTTSTDVSGSHQEHPRTVSAVEDGEGYPGDQQSYQHRIRRATSGCTTAELHSSFVHDIAHVVRTHCPMQWKSWKVMPDEIKTEVRGQLSTNYNLEDLDNESLAYVNRLFSKRYKQWKSDLHYYFEVFDDPQVALQEGCPKELEGREDSWAIKPKSIRAIGRRRLFSIIQGGSKFPDIDVFGDVYVRPRNEFAESLHINDDGGEEPVVCGSSTGCWVSNLYEDVGSDSQEEAEDILSRDLECQAKGTQTPFISAIKQSGDCFDSTGGHSSESDVVSHFDVPTSEPVHPEHPHQTTALVDPQTSEPHVPDDNVDFGTLFD